MFTKSRLITVAMSLVAVAVAYRVQPAKDLLTGNKSA